MINLKWIADTHAILDYHEKLDNLPVNPPGGHYTEGDIMLDNIGILNWLNDNNEFEFRPRLRDNLQEAPVKARYRMALDDEAPELDWEYDCD